MKLNDLLDEIKDCQKYERTFVAIEIDNYVLQVEPFVKIWTKKEFLEKENGQ